MVNTGQTEVCRSDGRVTVRNERGGRFLMPAGMPRYFRSIPVHEDPVHLNESVEHAPLLPARRQGLSVADPNATHKPEKRGQACSKRPRTAACQPSTLSSDGECSRPVRGASTSDLGIASSALGGEPGASTHNGTLALSSGAASPPNAQGSAAAADSTAAGAASCAISSATAAEDHDQHHEDEADDDDADADRDDVGQNDDDEEEDDDDAASHSVAALPACASSTPLATSALLLATDEVAHLHRTCTSMCTAHAPACTCTSMCIARVLDVHRTHTQHAHCT